MKSLLLIFSAVALVMSGCGSGNAKEEATTEVVTAPLTVQVAPVETRSVERSISVTGSLHPDEAAVVSNEVAGVLEAIRVDFGQPVRKGQVIAELDKVELKLQLDRTKAALARTLAGIGLSPDQAGETPETTPAIRQAQAQLENARTKYESASKLVKTGDVASDRYVEIEKAYNAAEAALDGARHELRVVLANVQSLRAEVALAEKRLEDATIRAPFDGTIQERLAAPGEYLRQNTPIIRLVKAYPLRLRVDIPETAAAAVRRGTGLTFRTDAFPGEVFEATVSDVNPSLDVRSRTLTAEARITQRDGQLRPGMFVQVEMVMERDAEIVVVPRKAIRAVAGLNKLFTVEDGRAVERKVILGKEYSGWVEVRDADFGPGEMVALDHLAELVNGMGVKPIQTGS